MPAHTHSSRSEQQVASGLGRNPPRQGPDSTSLTLKRNKAKSAPPGGFLKQKVVERNVWNGEGYNEHGQDLSVYRSRCRTVQRIC